MNREKKVVKLSWHVCKIERFVYLCIVIQKNNGLEEDMKHNIKCGYMKWKEVVGLLYDKYIPVRLKDQ